MTGRALLSRTTRRKRSSTSHAAVPYGHGIRLERIITIARSPEEVYAAWRDLERLPHLMPDVHRVVECGRSSRWLIGMRGRPKIGWNAELIDDTPNRRIAWRVDEGRVKHAGSVRFAPAPGGRGTEVVVEIEIEPPGGQLGRAVLRAAHASPQGLLDRDLRRFKSLLEAGGVALNGTDAAT